MRKYWRYVVELNCPMSAAMWMTAPRMTNHFLPKRSVR